MLICEVGLLFNALALQETLRGQGTVWAHLGAGSEGSVNTGIRCPQRGVSALVLKGHEWRLSISLEIWPRSVSLNISLSLNVSI